MQRTNKQPRNLKTIRTERELWSAPAQCRDAGVVLVTYGFNIPKRLTAVLCSHSACYRRALSSGDIRRTILQVLRTNFKALGGRNNVIRPSFPCIPRPGQSSSWSELESRQGRPLTTAGDILASLGTRCRTDNYDKMTELKTFEIFASGRVLVNYSESDIQAASSTATTIVRSFLS